MSSIKVRNLEIGTGIPKICVPIVGSTASDILKEAEHLLTLPVDLVEWRADYFEDVFQIASVLNLLGKLRDVLGTLPLLMTFRTKQEGGEKSIDRNYYISLIKNSISSGCIDLIDVELFSGDALAKELVDFAHECNVKVILSNHDFEKTPAKEDLLSRLVKMQELGADLPKIAVMPQSKKDVLTLLAVTEEMASSHSDTPVITMSMSKDGVISRLCGEYFGSAVTFGAAGRASAPGQVEVATLKKMMGELHGILK